MEGGKIRKKRALRNVGANLAYQVISLALGLVIPRLFMTRLGSESSGVLTTIKQIFACLTLLEAGVGTATVQALYKPVAEDDREAVNGILSATNIFYRRTGLFYIGAIAVLAVVFPLCTHSDLPNWMIAVLFLMNGFPSVLNFLIHAKYGLLMNVEGKQYVITALDTAMEIFTSVSRIVVLLLSDSLLLIQSIYVVTAVARTLFMVFYFRRNYGWIDFGVKPDFKAISQSGSVLVHQVAGTVFSNTDVILLSVFCDFSVANVYTIYSLFFTHVQLLITAVSGSFTFALGQLFHSNRARFDKLYRIYEASYMMGAYFVYTMMALFMLPVIQWYTSGVTDADYVRPVFVWLFVFINLLSQIVNPSTQVITIAGRFADTRSHAVGEMIINITVSVAAVYLWGLPGCLIGTICALLFRCFMDIRFANKEVLKRSVWGTMKYAVTDLAVFALVMLLKGGVRPMADPSFVNIFLGALRDLPWVAALFLGANYLLDPAAVKEALKKLFAMVAQKLGRAPKDAAR